MSHKDKTNKQWGIEWIGTTALFITEIVLIVYANTHLDVMHLKNIIEFVLLALLYIATFITFFIFIARTIGVIMMIAFPPEIAISADFTSDKIVITLKDGTKKEYVWTAIQSIYLTENFDGIFIVSDKKKENYQLPLSYDIIEKQIDSVLQQNPSILMKKEKEWTDSGRSGLNPNKNPNGVKRTYTDYVGKSHTPVEHTIESANGIENIIYTNESTAPIKH